MYRHIDEKYFEWLYSLVAPLTLRNPARSYWKLCEQLFKTPFTWSVPNDDNRIEDGRELRENFLDNRVDDVDPEWIALDVSVLEVLIALARRMSFDTREAPDLCFWEMVENLDLRKYSDLLYSQGHWEDVDAALDVFVNRKYNRNGEGGIFPLRQSQRNQKKVELWYQMAAYLLENHDF